MSKIYAKIVQIIFFAGLLGLFILKPALTLEYAKTGLSIWYQSMVPALLPMMILTSCMIKMDITGSFAFILYPITKKLYHLSKNGTYALLVGFLCGFPVGAKVICELYTQNKLSKSEATLLLPICNNIGPVFMITYALPIFSDKYQYILLILFYLLPLFYAFFLFRHKKVVTQNSHHTKKLSFCVALDEAISEGAAGILSLAGYLIFFSILTLVPRELIVLPDKISALISCCLEITNGLSYADGLPPYILLALLQFGGLSCIFQTIKFVSKTDLLIKHYLFHKLILSCITLVFFFLLNVFF